MCQFQNANDYLQHVDLDETIITTLVNDRKDFSHIEWKRLFGWSIILPKTYLLTVCPMKIF